MSLRRLSAIGLAALFSAAACGPGAPGTTPGGTPPGTPAGTPGGDVGTVTVGAGEPIHIGMLLVLTGPDADLGRDAQIGAQVAAEMAGNEILGHPISFNPQDDQCSAEGGTAGARALVSDPTIVAIIGTSCSSAGVPASQIASDAGVLIVSPSATAPSLTHPDTHQPFFLRTAHNDEVQGEAMARFAREVLQVERAASVHDGSPYSEQLQQVFRDRFQEFGGTLAGDAQAVAPTDTDMRPVLTTIAANDPGLIYYPIFTAGGALMTQQARENPDLEGVHLAGADGMQSPTFLNAAGEAAIGLFASGPDLAYAGTFYSEEFLPAYRQISGTEAPLSVFHAHAFDAMNMLIQVIEQVAVESGDGSLTIDRQQLRDAFFAIEGYEGVTGNLTCDENGDCADPKISVSEVARISDVPNPDDCGAASDTVCFLRVWPEEEPGGSPSPGASPGESPGASPGESPAASP
ncbi:MAG: branched-chain amino acid ABC transporter substrate-binding protein [Chloroflexota bacterium]|nr:branched-chain amino acid ABC transporter substrate-binding protein [Chloroflexota bacterium]